MRYPTLEIKGIEEGWIVGRLKGGDEKGCQKVVKAIGEAISNRFRSFNETHTEVSVDPSVFDVLIDTAMKAGSQVFMRETTDDLGPEEEPEEDDDPWSATLKLASNDVLKQIHKLLIISLHPDKGGNEEKMKKLNVYWDKIAKERGIK